MGERQLRAMIEAVREWTVSRREFVGTLIGLGLTAPIARQLLLFAGVAQAQAPFTQAPFTYKPATWDSDLWALHDWYCE